MNIIICGAGEVGYHAAEELAKANHAVTLIDTDAERLRSIEDTLDIATLVGNGAAANILRSAGAEKADVVIAATDRDEINLLSASIAKSVGAKKSIARVHHRAFFEKQGEEYCHHLGIDRLICPEFSTATAIACTLRNPGALAIENFGLGAIEMQEFSVTKGAPAVERSLTDIPIPDGSRLAAIIRKGGAFLPDAQTVIDPEDTVILVGNAEVFQEARRLFHTEDAGRRRVAIMGGASMTVWLCRALRDRSCSIRVFETDRTRAEELAEKLDWTTVIRGDPTVQSVFEEENLDQLDAFVALLLDDETNILGCAWAKSRGVENTIAVVQKANYMTLLNDVGIARAFSPRTVAVREIIDVIDESPQRHVSTLSEGIIEIYRVRVGKKSAAVGKALKDMKLSPDWVAVAIQHEHGVFVPRADDIFAEGDIVLVAGKHGKEAKLKKRFGAG